MISLAPGTRVYLACRPVDLRNGFDGLAAKAQQAIGADPFDGHLFIFRGCNGCMQAQIARIGTLTSGILPSYSPLSTVWIHKVVASWCW